MENETQGQATPPVIKPQNKESDIFGKFAALWKSGVKGKAICIVSSLVILGCIGACGNNEEGEGGGGWQISDKSFPSVFGGFPKDEGVVYKHEGNALKVMQATKNGNLVERDYSDRVIWVETKRRYEDGEPLDEGYYIRRGSKEYETALGAEKRVPRYVEVKGNLLKKIQKQIEDEKVAEAKAKANHETAIEKAKAEIVAMQAGETGGETKTIKLPGGVAMEMVWCPPGAFTMGSLNGDNDEKPPHQVTLTKGFWMGKTEVTQAQWKSVMGNNPSRAKGDDLPVEVVSWKDCQEFCEKTGLQLPTEAQWEYACRAGSTGPYAETGELDEMGWYEENSGGKTHPVGMKQPNAWGLYDMYGNVMEWCQDWYGDYPNGAVTDPRGASSSWSRIARGGSWDLPASYCASAHRGRYDPSNADYDRGFRLVRTCPNNAPR